MTARELLTELQALSEEEKRLEVQMFDGDFYMPIYEVKIERPNADLYFRTPERENRIVSLS